MTTPGFKFDFSHQHGFSLIELMVSIVMGLFLIIGVFNVYINGRQSQDTVDEQVTMVDNARFALETISADLRQAGVWGRTRETFKVNTTAVVIPDGWNEPVPGWLVNINAPVMAFDGDVNPYGGVVMADYFKGDVLEMRYTLRDRVAALQADRLYINSDVNQAQFFIGAASPNLSANADDYEYVANAYYIANNGDAGDGIPSLHRVSLQAGGVVDQVLLSGVEDMQVQIGLDTNTDGIVDSYVDPAAGINWKQAKSVQVWLVIRGEKTYPDLDTSTTANIAGDPAVSFANDGTRRMVVSTVASLRNF